MVFEMTGSTKRKAILVLALVMVIMVILAASLPRLELQPGMPPPRLEEGELAIAQSAEEPFVAVSLSEFVKVLIILMGAGLMVYLFYQLVRDAGRWKPASLILPILVFIVIVGGVLLLIWMLMSASPISLPEELPLPTPAPLVTSPLGSVPPWLVWLIGIGLLSISIVLGIRIFGLPSKRVTTIGRIGLEAEKAWQALRAGRTVKDVIIRCYRQMSLVLEKEQGIERQDFMTTREFEKFLEAAGVPRDPIHQLTQLFEAVRYGDGQPDPMDRQKAIRSLEAIILYSREAKRTG
jgi:hypothetical protein